LPLLVYQKSGLQAVVRELGLLKLLPKKLQAMEALLPKLGPAGSCRRGHAGSGNETRRVGFAAGPVVQRDSSRKSMRQRRELAAEGCESSHRRSKLCGAPAGHAGEEAAAVELAKRTIDAFERADVETS